MGSKFWVIFFGFTSRIFSVGSQQWNRVESVIGRIDSVGL